jgi:hypothetical protein
MGASTSAVKPLYFGEKKKNPEDFRGFSGIRTPFMSDKTAHEWGTRRLVRFRKFGS